MLKNILALFLLAQLHSTIAENHFQRDPSLVSGECSIFLQVIVGINSNFFDDQFSITIIDPSDESAANSFKCVDDGTYVAVQVFDDILQIDLGDETDTSSVSSYSLTNGMFVKVMYDDCMGLLKIISTHNPRSKVLIHLTDGDMDNAKDVLRSAFDDLKMLNLAIVLVTPDDEFTGKLFATLLY
jgi:hypothetical protein